MLATVLNMYDAVHDAVARQRYQGSSKSLSPIPYSQFPEPLGADTVRLLVVPLAPQADELVSSITELSRAFQAALPNGLALSFL